RIMYEHLRPSHAGIFGGVDADILRSCTDTHICHDHAFLRVDKSHISTGEVKLLSHPSHTAVVGSIQKARLFNFGLTNPTQAAIGEGKEDRTRIIGAVKPVRGNV